MSFHLRSFCWNRSRVVRNIWIWVSPWVWLHFFFHNETQDFEGTSECFKYFYSVNQNLTFDLWITSVQPISHNPKPWTSAFTRCSLSHAKNKIRFPQKILIFTDTVSPSLVDVLILFKQFGCVKIFFIVKEHSDGIFTRDGSQSQSLEINLNRFQQARPLNKVCHNTSSYSLILKLSNFVDVFFLNPFSGNI